MVLPIPRLAPVIIAVFPLSVFSILPLHIQRVILDPMGIIFFQL
jgi:hypothetical protein